ncbi:hypothetical protein [Lutibacter sp.]|uniref:hypothetical protein n=1 Tax=Lutibacter sp. TaxID=1925666 RepID=UPI0025B9255E|nr:hypothetical protein [Lutibacter sp.]MCF6167085.1 hypothetical protein [Lutibacter sp.]
MGSRYFKSKKLNFFQKAKLSNTVIKKEVEKINFYYDFLNCKIENRKLVCTGKTKPTATSEEYSFRIIYDGENSPKVFVDNPVIEYNDDIHMYPTDNSLCLYHKTDLINERWSNKNYSLFDTIIPWTLEWFVFYELYLITGKWEHPFVPHNFSK